VSGRQATSAGSIPPPRPTTRAAAPSDTAADTLAPDERVRLGHLVRWICTRRHLVAAIRQRPPEPGESAASAYYAAWLDAVEALLTEHGLLP